VGAEAEGFVQAVFRLHDRSAIRRLLDAAGFEDVAVHRQTYELRLAAPKDFLWQYVSSTPLARAVGPVGEDRRAALEHDVLEGWAAFVDSGRLLLVMDVVYATGRRSEPLTTDASYSGVT
jgi:hypothetical protein